MTAVAGKRVVAGQQKNVRKGRRIVESDSDSAAEEPLSSSPTDQFLNCKVLKVGKKKRGSQKWWYLLDWGANMGEPSWEPDTDVGPGKTNPSCQ